MKTNLTLITLLTFAVVIMAVPAFAQHGGLGAGVGLGGGARVGTGAGAQAGGATVGAGTHADVHTDTSVNASSGRSDDHANAHAGTGIVTRIDANPELASRVQAMLPSGMSMSTAAAGFRNEGQFLAALHVSQNLGIPFSELKAKMTGSEHMSLGEAIKSSKPKMSNDEAKEEAKKADKQAKVTASAKETASAATKVEDSGKR
jgi:hypothetical protein